MAIRITSKISGSAELLQVLARLKRGAPGATAAAVYQEALIIARRASGLVPVDTSLLKNSEYVTLPSTSSPDPTSQIGFSAPYALPVHERTEVHHENGQANYLRAPWQAALGGYARRLAARTLAYIKQGINAPSPDSRFPTEPQKAEVLLKRVERHLKRQKHLSHEDRARGLARARAALARGVRVKV